MLIAKPITHHPHAPPHRTAPTRQGKMASFPIEPLSLPSRFAQIKENLVGGKESAINASWKRLLRQLKREVEEINSGGSDIIPTIDYHDIATSGPLENFKKEVKKRGAGIIRRVIPSDLATTWGKETRTYIHSNPPVISIPAKDPDLHGIYWSPGQIKARAHPNVLNAQRFIMNIWQTCDEDALVGSNFPVSYSDRLRMQTPTDSSYQITPHITGGSVERWEPDGYGLGGVYQKIWDGKWEEYDPWESSTRLKVTTDLYNCAGSCNMFRMFQGWLSLSDVDPHDGTLLLCPMIKLSTAYFLLRPFFSPKVARGSDFLHEDNWVLDIKQTSLIQGSLPGYTQELNDLLHPHLELNRSMVHIPALQPGDYVIWHCDMIYGMDGIRDDHNETDRGDGALTMFLPACPLTLNNALYLGRQRKTFLLGKPSPDFGSGRGESLHVGRLEVQDINDAGANDGLRAMGLLPWDEYEADSQAQIELLGMANAILFPDRFDMF
jgi:hypothetical protein